jgi:polyribonucleotide 5'-hydroxyl-kinase
VCTRLCPLLLLLLPAGVGKMTWLIDFEGYSMRNAPPIRTSINVMQILQNHYPERLGGAVCYHAPALFSLTWRAVGPWIDPVTKKKIAFVDKGKGEAAQMAEWFNMEHIEACMGGSYPRDLFVLPEYRARMQAEDAALALSLKMAAAKGSPSSNSIDSNMSEGGTMPSSLAALQQQQQQAVAV